MCLDIEVDPENFTFRESGICIVITIGDDDMHMNDRQFEVTVSLPFDRFVISNLTTMSATISIIEDDGMWTT